MWSKKNFNKTWKYKLYQLCSISADYCFSMSSHVWQLLWPRAGGKLMKKKKQKNPKTYAEWWSFKPICQIDLERPFHRTLALTKSPHSHLYPGQSANLTTSFQQPWVGICVQLLMEGSVLKPLLSPLPLKSICSVLFHIQLLFLVQ